MSVDNSRTQFPDQSSPYPSPEEDEVPGTAPFPIHSYKDGQQMGAAGRSVKSDLVTEVPTPIVEGVSGQYSDDNAFNDNFYVGSFPVDEDGVELYLNLVMGEYSREHTSDDFDIRLNRIHNALGLEEHPGPDAVYLQHPDGRRGWEDNAVKRDPHDINFGSGDDMMPVPKDGRFDRESIGSIRIFLQGEDEVPTLSHLVDCDEEFYLGLEAVEGEYRMMVMSPSHRKMSKKLEQIHSIYSVL